MVGIYKIINSEGSVYIGQSKNILGRFDFYKKVKCKNQFLLLESLRKYGWFNHKFEVIEECSPNKLNIREEYWIKYYSKTSNSLNLTHNSNRNLVYTPKVREKQSKSLKQAWSEGRHQGRGKKKCKHIPTGKIYNSIKEAREGLKLGFSKTYKMLGEGEILTYI